MPVLCKLVRLLVNIFAQLQFLNQGEDRLVNFSGLTNSRPLDMRIQPKRIETVAKCLKVLKFPTLD